MRTITLKTAFASIVFCSFFSVNAQTQPTLKEGVVGQTERQSINFEINNQNQEFRQQNGVVRCATVEYNEALRQTYPERQTMEQFEEWLAPLIEERKARLAQQRASGNYIMSTYSIPVIFHVLAPSVGHAADLDAQYVNAQIDQLNLDFSNQSGSTHPAAADSGIQFVPAQVDPNGDPLAEPGIVRHYDPSYTALDSNDLDNGIKQATIWDRTQYANIWTADLSGGLLGYAQFPSNSTLPGMPTNGGAATTDGVVCLYTSIGSVANPHPDGGVYAAGRTLTHEIGHWIGLRHIWGDTNACSNDDYCADTPDATGSNGGCPTVDSCAADGLGNDMVENYMDYTYDTCMNIFTNDQVGRMVTVIQNADAFGDLINSTTGVSGPVVSFVSINSSSNEGNTCSYTDITTGVKLETAATGNTTVNFSVGAGGTATNNVDFQLMTSSVSFASGTTGTRDMTVRVFHDAFVEGDETIQIDLAVSGSDAQAGADTLTLTISDDDTASTPTYANVVFSDDIQGATLDWTTFDDDGDTYSWGAASSLTYTGNSIEDTFLYSESVELLSGSGDGTTNLTPDNYIYNSNPITISAAAVNVNFNFGIGSYRQELPARGEPYEVYWTTDVSSAAAMQSLLLDSGTAIDGDGEFRNIDITTIAGQTGYIVFRHISPGTNGGNRTRGLLLVDNITITETVTTAIQTAVNDGTTNDQFSLSNSGIVYTQDTSSGDVMVDITNNNGVDYGCTTASVSRASGAAQMYQVAGVENYVMGKTFTITPTSVQALGDATVKFYFTETEIAQWESDTGNVRGDLRVIKDNGAVETVTATIGAFGSHVTLETTFATGINGTYYFGKEQPLSVGSTDYALFSVYPNPSKNYLDIILGTNEDVQISLFDIRGRQILTELKNNVNDTFSTRLNLEGVSSGVYLLNVKSGNKTATKKIVIE